jgi:hypothetical protein
MVWQQAIGVVPFYRSIGVGQADLPVIGLTDIDRCLVALPNAETIARRLTTCVWISRAPGTSMSRGIRRNCLSQGPLSDIQGTTKPARRQWENFRTDKKARQFSRRAQKVGERSNRQ